jgi:hypothetical protein
LGDSDPVPAGSIVIGDPVALVLHEALVEPGVVFDVSHGTVVVEGGGDPRRDAPRGPPGGRNLAAARRRHPRLGDRPALQRARRVGVLGVPGLRQQGA